MFQTWANSQEQHDNTAKGLNAGGADRASHLATHSSLKYFLLVLRDMGLWGSTGSRWVVRLDALGGFFQPLVIL